MAKRTVIWAPIASKQLRKVLDYWNKRNKSTSYSRKLMTLIKDNLEDVKNYPESCPLTVVPEIRVSVLKHYSIFYYVENNSIIIVSFWDNRQDPERLKSILIKTQQG